MATNLQEALSSGTPAAAGAKPITMESLPEASIDVEGGASSLDIEGLGVKKSKDGLSAGTTSSTASISTEDFFADLLAETDFNNADSVFSFRNGVIERISETDPATLSSLTASSLTAPSQAAASSSASRPSPSGFDTLFGGSGDGDDAGEDASYGSLDSDSSGSFSEAEAASSAYSDAERAGMAGVVGKGLGAMQGLASGRDFSAASLATSAISSTDLGAAYGAYSNISGLANNVSGIDSISGGLNAANAALGAIGAIGDVTDALSSGRSFTDIAEAAFDNIADVAQTAWSAIQDPAAALDAFGMEAQYGSQTPAVFSFDLPGWTANFNFDATTGKLATPGFISMMMGLSPLSTAFSLAQRGLGAIGYDDTMSDRASGMADAFSMGGVSLSAAEKGVAGVTSYSSPYGVNSAVNSLGQTETVGAYASMDMADVPGDHSSFGLDLGALSSAMNAAGVTDVSGVTMGMLEEAQYGMNMYDWDEEQAALDGITGGLSAAGMGTAKDMADASREASEQSQAVAAAFNSMMGIDPANIDMGIAGIGATTATSMSQNPVEALAAHMQINSYMALATPLTLEQARAMATQALASKATADLSAQGQAAAENYNAQAPSFETIEAMQQLGYDYISMNAYQMQAEKEALAAKINANKEAARDRESDPETDYSDYADKSIEDDPSESGEGAATSGPDASPGAQDSTGDDADSADSGTGSGGPGAPGATDSTGDTADSDDSGTGSGGDCFVQGTLVLMAEGSTKAIEKVVVGDLVAGKDGKANKVEATHIKKPDIPFLYGFNGHKPFVTAYHPFMTKEGWGCFEPQKFKEHRPTAYQEIANEQGGKDLIKIENNCELLRSDNQWVLVEDIVVEGCDPNLAVYNLSVANDKTFVANNYIVHNKGECFIPTAQVTMFDGSNKQIKDIKVGDKVMSVDGEVNTVIATPVFNLGDNKIHGFNGKQPFVTSMHPILTKEGWKNFNPKAYKESWPEDYEKVASENADGVIHEITEKDELAWKSSRDGVTYITFKDPTVLHEDSNFKVYNLTLDGDHTFVVEGLVVHNKGGKIICTAMNQMYGFGSYRNALWMQYQKSHMAAEEYQLGYHKLIMPLVKKMPTNKTIRTILERIARRRTINMRKELRGQKLPLYYRLMKYTVRPLFFAVGWLVKKKILSKVKV